MKKKMSSATAIIWGLVFVALAVVILCIMVTMIPVKQRSTKAQKYDLKCTTEMKKNPLEECKEEE